MRQPYSSKLEIPVPVSVSFEMEGVAEPAAGWIARLSLAGVDIESLHIPTIGSKIVFHCALNPDSAEVFTFTGLVRWVSGAKIGIQFLELGPKETHAIVEAMRVATGDGSIVSERHAQLPSRAQAQSSINLVRPVAEEKIEEIPITFEDEG